MSKLRRKFITVLAVLICALLALSTALIIPKNEKSAEAKPVTDPANVLNDLVVNYTSGYGIDRDNLNALYNRLNNNTADTTYSTIASKAASTVNATTIAGSSEFSVRFGGYEWAPVYLSKTNGNAGDVILTLWLSDILPAMTNTGVSYAAFVNGGNGSYPSPMYSTSLARSYLVGSPYATSINQLPTNSAQNSAWREFITNYGNYMTTPGDVSWQLNQSATVSLIGKSGATYFPNQSWESNLPNESSGKNNIPNSSKWIYNINISGNSMYCDWAGDKLWTPSLTETGTAVPENGYDWYGIWHCTTNQLRSSKSVWLRSSTNYTSQYYLYGSGAYSDHNVYDTSLSTSSGGGGMRPAFHLNLTKLEQVAKYHTAKPADDSMSPTYNGSRQTWTISENSNLDYKLAQKADSLGKDDATYESGSFKATNVGEYLVNATPKEGYVWKTTGGTDAVKYTFKINPKPITLKISVSPTGHEYGLPPDDITASIDTPASGVFAGDDNWQELCADIQYIATQGSTKFFVSDLKSKPVGIYSVTSELTLQNYTVKFTAATYTVRAHTNHDYSGDIEHIDGTKTHKQYCIATGCTEFKILDCSISTELETPSTCTTFGHTDYVCSECGVYTITATEKAPHDFSGEWNTGNENSHWHVCAMCGSETDTPAPHQFEIDGDIQWGANGGTKTEKCTDCGRTRTVNISSGDYEEIDLPTVSGTLVYNGEAQEVQLSGYDGDTMSAIEYYASQGGTTTVTPKNAGTYYAKVTLTDNGLKFKGTFERFVWIEFTIEKAPLTVTAKDKQISYGDSAANDGVTYSGFVLSEDEGVLTGTLTYTYGDYSVGSGVGEYDILPAGLEAANYEIEFLEGTLEVVPKEITLTISDAGHNYGTTVAAIGLEQPDAGVLVGDDTTDCILALLSFVLKEKSSPYAEVVLSSTLNVGTYEITAEAGVYGNYNVTAFTSGTYTVSKGDYDMSVVEFDDGADYIYTGEEIEHTLTGNLPDGVSVEYWYEGVDGTDYASSQTPPTEMGSYKVTAKFTGDSSNYNDIPDMTSTFTVSPAGIDAPVAADRKYVYDGSFQEFQFEDGFDSETMEVSYSDEEGNPVQGKPKNAGTYIVRVTSVNSNVKFNVDGVNRSFVEYTFTIEKAKLTVTAKDKEIIYGTAAANDGVIYSGFVAAEGEEVLSGTLAYTYGNYEAGSDVGTYEILPSGLDADNYEIEYVDGKLTVVPKAITLTIEDSGHKQGEAPVTEYKFVQPENGVLVGDDTLAVFDGVKFTIKDGKGATVTLSTQTEAGEYAITAADGVYGNYEVTFVPGKYVVTEGVKADDLDEKKQEAKDALEDAAKKKKDEIDNNPDLTDEDKKAAKDKVDEELKKGKDAIDSATSADGVEKSLGEGKREIENIKAEHVDNTENGGSFPWWIIGVIAGVLAILAAIIVIVLKKRNSEDDEDDYYNDDYDYDDEEIEEEEYEDDFGDDF